MPPVYHFCEQYSDQYDRLKLGLPTSSSFDKIITPDGKPSKSWEKYAYHLIAERCLERHINTYTSPYMETALMSEADAAAWYEFDHEVQVKKVGFVTNEKKTIGCSPDRLVGEDGLLEIKCPQPQTQIEYLLTGKVDRKYWPQLQGQLFVTERRFVDIVAWHAELPRTVIRVERDVEYIACLEKLLENFNTFLESVMDKISSVVHPEPPNYLLAC